MYIPLSGPLYRVAYYILESREEAEDAVHDLFMKLWRLRENLETVTSPKAYCISMMRNLCIDRIRTSGPRREELNEMIFGEDTERRMYGREELKRTAKAIEGLPQTERKVLEMRVFEGLDYDEIARRTSMTEASLRVILSRARKRLKERKQ